MEIKELIVKNKKDFEPLCDKTTEDKISKSDIQSVIKVLKSI